MRHAWAKVTALAVMIGTALVVGSLAMAADDEAIPSDRQAKWLARHPEMDADGDGTLTREETRQFLRARRAKRRGEGAGDEPPGKPPSKRGMAGRFHRSDPAKILEQHPEADTDGDGTLSREEFMALRQQVPGGPGPGPFRQPPHFFDWLIEHFSEADLDGSGELSKKELLKLKDKYAGRGKGALWPGAGPAGAGPDPERLIQRFPDADTDGDGQLSDEEMRTLKEKHKRRGDQPRGQGRGPRAKGKHPHTASQPSP